eukprot:6212057-Pleurochrysis_carterae.AAC.2
MEANFYFSDRSVGSAESKTTGCAISLFCCCADHCGASLPRVGCRSERSATGIKNTRCDLVLLAVISLHLLWSVRYARSKTRTAPRTGFCTLNHESTYTSPLRSSCESWLVEFICKEIHRDTVTVELLPVQGIARMHEGCAYTFFTTLYSR